MLARPLRIDLAAGVLGCVSGPRIVGVAVAVAVVAAVGGYDVRRLKDADHDPPDQKKKRRKGKEGKKQASCCRQSKNRRRIR